MLIFKSVLCSHQTHAVAYTVIQKINTVSENIIITEITMKVLSCCFVILLKQNLIHIYYVLAK